MNGVTFNELLRGPFVFGRHDPATGKKDGLKNGQEMVLRTTVVVPDLDAFIHDPKHAARVEGEVECSAWAQTVKVHDGQFFFLRPAKTPATKIIEYALRLDVKGKPYFLNGRKQIHDDAGLDLFRDIATLEVVLFEGQDATGPIAGAGILKFGFKDPLMILRSMRAIGTATRLEGLETTTRFFRFFLGELWDTYVLQGGPAPKARMVGWYDPKLFLRAGMEVVVSSLFAQYADQRLLQAAAGPAEVYHYTPWGRQTVTLNGGPLPELPGERQEMWLDYISDTGDGFDSSYAVAYLATQPELTLPTPDGDEVSLPPGDVVVFGGDQVYPSASREDYQRRLVAPYRAAFGVRAPGCYPDVFAIPGNHDWYDGLVSFSRVFCSREPFAGPGSARATELGHGCDTPQRRSYFALKLPHGWWLLGTDVQLKSDLDGPQLNYFKSVVNAMGPDDRVILCVAEPHWLHPKRAKEGIRREEQTALDVLESQVLGDRVHVFLAGDVHHYKRYGSEDGIQKITAGGGGAFLHPTHGPWKNEVREADGRVLSHRASFPDQRTSWRLGLRNALFLFLNPKFGVLTGIGYIILALLFLPAILRYQTARDNERKPQLEMIVQNLVKQELALLSQRAPGDRRPPEFSPRTREMLERYESYMRPKSFKERIQAMQPDSPAQSAAREREEVESAIPRPIFEPSSATPIPSVPLTLPKKEVYRFWPVLWEVLHNEAKLVDPFQTLLFSVISVVIVFGFYYFTDIPEKPLRFLFGGIHAVTYMITAFYFVWFSLFWLMPRLEPLIGWDLDYFSNWIILSIAFAGGFVLGPIIMGLYLGISLNVFKRHWNEAFSSLKIADWKNFLRLHIDAAGRLTIYPIGIRKVPRKWKDNPREEGSRVVPAGRRGIRAELIEAPIRVDRG